MTLRQIPQWHDSISISISLKILKLSLLYSLFFFDFLQIIQDFQKYFICFILTIKITYVEFLFFSAFNQPNTCYSRLVSVSLFGFFIFGSKCIRKWQLFLFHNKLNPSSCSIQYCFIVKYKIHRSVKKRIENIDRPKTRRDKNI